MTEQDWAEEPEVPPKKKGLPGWLMFCGAGCLILVVLGAVGGFWAFNKFKDVVDQDAQWAKLDERIGIDDSDSSWLVMGAGLGGVDGWVFTKGETACTLMIFSEDQGEEAREEMFGGDFKGTSVPGLVKMDGIEPGEVVVQGRTLPLLRFTQDQTGVGERRGVTVDLTPPDSPEFWMLQYVHNDNIGAVSDETLIEFLAPFHVGPDRETYIPNASLRTLDSPEENPEDWDDADPAPTEEGE